MRILAAVAIAVMSISAAQAQCVITPDTTATRNVENGQAYMLCLQRELADEAQQRAEQMRLEAEINAMRMQMQLQQRLNGIASPPAAWPWI